MTASKVSAHPECIRLRGVRQNNLKGFDLDLPLGRFIVVTGLSGSGKSSLVFDTLHAEGQRRYVETFSAYTRQFLDLLDKPRVDSVENIRPSIAIEQRNTVKTSRSTVGTMTELTDFAKVWFSQVASCFDPETGEPVEDDTPETIWRKAAAGQPGAAVVVAFRVDRPEKISWPEILTSLAGQSYVRVLVEETPADEGAPSLLCAHRVDALRADPSSLTDAGRLFVAQDRLTINAAAEGRFREAVETALHFGKGEVHLFRDAGEGRFVPAGHHSRGLHSPATGRVFRPATPALFSFNSPLGACPRCRGFGRIIELDTRLAIPDQSLSIEDGAIRCWESEVYGDSKRDLLSIARKRGIPTTIPFAALNPEQQRLVIDGDADYDEEGNSWPRRWYGLKGFFRWLERNAYKMHVRVFLSRYRAYNPCPDCGGARLQPESLCWKWRGFTLPQLYQLPVDQLRKLLAQPDAEPRGGASARSATLALESMLTRLRYLEQVGLAHLTIDRPSRTLSGGEVERVNLTSCLGTSLVDTLFVLDEPSVGLHPRDVDRLIDIIRTLTSAGNTVVVVEHDEAVIRAADQVVEIGPGPGERGGEVIFQGSVPAMLADDRSLTGAYLSGRETIPVPTSRRPVPPDHPALHIEHASKHNIEGLSFRVPLGRLVALSGVSGSGKSTLLDNVIHQGLLTQRHQLAEDPAVIGALRLDRPIGEVVLVDQSPLARTPRSNPALHVDAWDLVRELLAETPQALAAGLGASAFSFNSGEGRCHHCQGLGHERVEMQFLSDVFVPCPECDGRRFKPEVLAIRWNGRTVADLLATSVDDALELFAAETVIRDRLAPLAAVGLGYLKLGQPLNTLSGGESQRLKLVRHLGAFTTKDAPAPDAGPALLLLDEPTTGLHRHDVKRLLGVLQTLVERGHSVVVIEHNLDVLKAADWILEIGPGAGVEGGRIVTAGTPEEVARTTAATAPFLRSALHGVQREDISALPLAAEPEPFTPAPRVLHLLGARENNLKDVSLTLPHHRLNVVTGVSGSGKSTLAFDIIFAEGQRRFMESMSPYARQFVEQLPRPAIDRLSGIPPTVAIEQRVTRGSRKSTVATITEVAQYLRLLYARLGVQHHPDTGRPVTPMSPLALRRLLTKVVTTDPRAKKARHLYLCAPLIRGRKGHHQPIATWIGGQGFTLMRADGKLTRVDAFQKLDRYREHDIEVVVADFKDPAATKPELRTPGAALDEALKLGRGTCFLLTQQGDILSWFSTDRTDQETGESFPELDPKNFSFNSPRGWCPSCRGHGRVFPWMLIPDEETEDDPAARLRAFGIDDAADVADEGEACPECSGERLNRVSRAVRLHVRGGDAPLSLPALLASTPGELLQRLRRLELDRRGRLIFTDVLPQIEGRLKFLDEVGLGYLPLDRPTDTLSGGEAQRIRLAAQLGSNLSGVLYVLDEPSIGLHARDNDRLIGTLGRLRDRGNTLLVVEHDDELMERADVIVDLGPGAGVHGGELLACGSPEEIRGNNRSLTGRFLARGIAHPLRGARRPAPDRDEKGAWLTLSEARFRNLKGFDLRIPLARLTMVAGPSGAGKSTLIRDLLRPAVEHAIKAQKNLLKGGSFARANGPGGGAAPFHELRGAAGFRRVIEVDQSPIGKTPRSTPATYLGIFDLIRQYFAGLPEAKIRGHTASRFSFNTTGGRCAACEGAGRIKLEMAFMPDVYLPCDSCGGSRFGPDLADIAWKGRSIGGVLALTFDEAAEFLDFHPHLAAVCRLMVDCGLGYLTLGQSSPTLSGGEAQRLKLVSELAAGLASFRERGRGETPRNLYLLEEPTIGLHLSDCEKLIRVLHSLVDQGHTVVVIEHHLDLLAEADHLLELGPDGGPEGGELLYQGTPEGLLKVRRSPTAPYLKKLLGKRAPGGK